jgi:hypothetical protein
MSNTNSITQHAPDAKRGQSFAGAAVHPCVRKPWARRCRKLATLALALLAVVCGHDAAQAASREQAKRMFDRLTGTPPSPTVLNQLEAALGPSPTVEQLADVAYDEILSSPRGRDFYNVTLKNFATPWTNREQSAFEALNDYTATVIGIVRDNEDHDFREILWDDVLYVGPGSPPTPTSNAHYEALESNFADLQQVLQRTTQSAVYGIPSEATAGVITSRAAAQAFFIAGTNRAMFRFTLLNHLCRDMEQLNDIRLPPDRIRQDVSRSPGGDSSVFLNNCVGCHNGMDPMAQAFAYYDFDEAQGRLIYTPGTVRPKYFINADNFRPGYVTPDDSWENRWRLPGPNNALGWDPDLPGSGNGAKSLGRELAYSDAFAECQVEKVFRAICFRSPSEGDERRFQDLTAGFKATGNLKRVFAEVAAHCAGE